MGSDRDDFGDGDVWTDFRRGTRGHRRLLVAIVRTPEGRAISVRSAEV
ncbi:hypothetical protein [Sphingopyxis terrae]